MTADSSHYLDSFTNAAHEEAKKENDASQKGWFSGSSSSGTPSTSKKVSASSAMRGHYQSLIGSGSAFAISASKPVKSSIAVEVVRNVDVEPKFKSLYIGSHAQTYKLRILNGSGAFSVTLNNTRLADFVQKDREIHITPKELGGLKIMVEDLELPQSQVATAELLISDIAKLTLWAPLTLIEKGDEIELTVSAFDSFMQEFDLD